MDKKQNVGQAFREALLDFIFYKIGGSNPEEKRTDESDWPADMQPDSVIEYLSSLAGGVESCTHIARGMNAASRGSNAFFDRVVFHRYMGTHSVQRVDGNYGQVDFVSKQGPRAMRLISFLAQPVDGFGTVGQMIVDHPRQIQPFIHSDADKSEQIIVSLSGCLNASQDERSLRVDGHIPQMYWPMPEKGYRLLAPLHASVLTYSLHVRIQETLNSEQNSEAWKEGGVFKVLPQRVMFNLGGSNPQNISWLTSKQRGDLTLLPCFAPPSLDASVKSGYPLADYPLTKSVFRPALLCNKNDPLIEALARNIEQTVTESGCFSAESVALCRILLDLLIRAAMLMRERFRVENKDEAWWQTAELCVEQRIWLDPVGSEADPRLKGMLQEEGGRVWKDALTAQFVAMAGEIACRFVTDETHAEQIKQFIAADGADIFREVFL